MKTIFRNYPLFFLLCSVVFWGGCETTSDYQQFVKTVNFSALDTFKVKQVSLLGDDWESDDQDLLTKVSLEAIASELEARDFEAVESAVEADFIAVVSWGKILVDETAKYKDFHGPDFDPYVSGGASPRMLFSPKLRLVVEFSDARSGDLFWRAEESGVLDPGKINSSLIQSEIARAVEKFPRRIPKDPNLPSIE